jgi:hypothetical protein
MTTGTTARSGTVGVPALKAARAAQLAGQIDRSAMSGLHQQGVSLLELAWIFDASVTDVQTELRSKA